MKILMVTPELAPVVPVGGIAEYVLGLATALLRRGHQVRVAIPAYGYLRSKSNFQVVNERLVVQLGTGASEVTSVYEMAMDCPGDERLRLPVIALGEHKHLATVRSPQDVYQWPNHEPWIAFSRAVVDLCNSGYWQPDVIHCQDAHTALVPVYLKQLRQDWPRAPAHSIKTVLTIHNLLAQGVGAPALVAYAGLPADWFDIEGFEYYGQANCFKAGLLSADGVNTVSRTYAQEICASDEFGFGLAGVLRRLNDEGRLVGIVNGIDEKRWSLPGVHYDGSDLSVLDQKRALRRKMYPQWPEDDEPVLAFRSRWDNQKGVGLLVECAGRILDRARLVVCVWGTPGATPELRALWRTLSDLAERQPSRLLVNPAGINAVDETAAHYTLADFFLMPSRYEPCGLTQMECQRYGTIPIVRETGGLADTVFEEAVPDLPSPNGFVFKEMTADALMGAVERAIEAFHDPAKHAELVKNTLRQKNGWDSRVSQYESLFGA